MADQDRPDATADQPDGGAVAHVVPRDVVVVRGADAVTFLQGQLSADVAALTPGGWTWSLLLEPQGKVGAWLRVWRRPAAGGVDEVLLDVDGGYADAVVTRLRRFLLRVDVAFEPLSWRCVSVRGPHWVVPDAAEVGAELVGPVEGPGWRGADLLGPDVAFPAGAAEVGADEWTARRVEAGWPAMGHELDDTVIPAELGQWLVDASASFTKGCYTGQELVARVDSRGGNTPRRLRGLVVAGDGSAVPPEGAAVEVDGEARGRLTTVAAVPGGAVALGFVHRSVEPPADATLRWDGGTATARVAALPLVDRSGAGGG